MNTFNAQSVDFLTAIWRVTYTLTNGDKISVEVPDGVEDSFERAVKLSKGMRMGYFESPMFNIDIERKDGTFGSMAGSVIINLDNVLFNECRATHYTRDENGEFEFDGIKYTEEKKEN